MNTTTVLITRPRPDSPSWRVCCYREGVGCLASCTFATEADAEAWAAGLAASYSAQYVERPAAVAVDLRAPAATVEKFKKRRKVA